MAPVDTFSPAAAPAPTKPAEGTAEFYCSACGEAFASAAELRAHSKTERHVYNTKRRLNGLKPISQEAWERKLREARGGGGGAAKGTAHLKAGKAPRSKAGSEASPEAVPPPQPEGGVDGDDAAASPERTAGESDEKEAEPPFSPLRCLFDRRTFDTVEENLKYMQKTYDFVVPDREYCTDLNGLLEALWRKINEPPYICIFCNRKFPDAAAARKHMVDKRHCRIGTEARTRRGGTDELASQEMQSDIEDFYDFHSSTREVSERITNPSDRAACLVRFFDADRDGFLKYKELAALWAAASAAAAPPEAAQEAAAEGDAPAPAPAPAAEPSAALPEAMYRAACAKAGADPEEGLDAEALGRLYKEGLADIDAHFSMLQDMLARKLKSKDKLSKRLQQVVEEDEEEEETESDENGEAEGDDNNDEDDGSGSEAEVWECDDEEEFEEVMRVLGLQPVAILDNGDIRLPSGRVAAHREVAHIWKQRGIHTGQLAIAGATSGPRLRPMFAISNGGEGTMSVSERERHRENKKVVAVLRRKQVYDLKQGMKNNKMQRKTLKIRTGMGDASGGR